MALDTEDIRPYQGQHANPPATPKKSLLAAIAARLGPAVGKVRDFGADFGQGLAQGAFNLLPDPEDVRFIAQAAQQAGAAGASPFEAALSGSLVGGPMASEQFKLAKDKALLNAALKELAAGDRKTALKLRSLLIPGGAGGELDISGEKITVPAQPTRLATAEALGRAQAGLVGPTTRTKAEIEAEFEKKKQATVTAEKVKEQSVSDATAAVNQRRKDFESRFKESTSNELTQAAFVELHKAELRRNLLLQKAGRSPVSLTINTMPKNSILRKAIELEKERARLRKQVPGGQ